MYTPATAEVPPAETESANAELAEQLAQSFVDCCLDDDGQPTERGLELINKLRDVQFYLIGSTTQNERKQQQYPPPGTKRGHYIYGECCVVAADPDPAHNGELLIVRRDTAVKDARQGEHWLAVRYQLNTGELEDVRVYQADIRGAKDGADVSLVILSGTEVSNESDIAMVRFHAVGGDYAEQGAEVVLPQYYGRTYRTLANYSVDYSDLRQAIDLRFASENPRLFGALSQPDPVTAEQCRQLEPQDYERAA